ncbi:MAG: DUF1934 domain-containing protein, partial [Oscillospiraceae bacterium]|nr:DUF1934 domain-containing protein [Oscillospiraceae bacterium]
MDCTISILGSQETPGDEEERFELITEGRFTRDGDNVEIIYPDMGDVSFDAPETIFLVEPSRITLTRDSWYGGDMVFDEAAKHHFIYQTPFGSLT